MLASDFDCADSAFVSAAACGTEVRYLTLAGALVRFEVAGPELFAALYPALSHLEGAGHIDSPVEPSLTVRVWDAAATGVPNPEGPTGNPGLNGTVDVSEDRRRFRYRRQTSTAWVDRDGQTIVSCFASAGSVSLNDRGKPLQFPFAVWHLDRGVPLVHGGVVARGGRGLIFPGKGGSGKTTASLSCALAGYDYVGDDCVGLARLPDGSVCAHGVFSSTNIAHRHLDRFPQFKAHARMGTTPTEDKHLVLLAGLLPRPIARSAVVNAIVLPRVAGDGPTRLSPASRAEVLRAFAPSTMLYFPGWGAGQLDFLADVVTRVPGYRLDMSPRLEEIPLCLDELVRG